MNVRVDTPLALRVLWISLDGYCMTHVVQADDVQGFVDVRRRNETNGFDTIRLYGRVSIALTPETRAMKAYWQRQRKIRPVGGGRSLSLQGVRR